MARSQVATCFGATVRRLRYHLGLSQEELAERAGLHRTYIAAIEGRGRNVTLKSMVKLAKALKVSIPCLLSRANGAEKRGRTVQSPSTSFRSVDILMVEDNRDDVEMTVEAFKHARITNVMQVVYDGKEALDFLFCTGRFAGRNIKDRPHLVLLDLNLPKVGGIEVLRRIKADERTRAIPVVVLTSARDARELAECRRLGAETSIIKPVDFQNLSQATPSLRLDWALLKPAAPAYEA